MASKRQDLCPNTQQKLLAKLKPDGSTRSEDEECPFCVFLIGAHNLDAPPSQQQAGLFGSIMRRAVSSDRDC